jgi:hypothetical protein
MPFMPPLKKSQPHLKAKRTTSPPPGATPTRKIALPKRDPRAGKPASAKSPSKRYG